LKYFPLLGSTKTFRGVVECQTETINVFGQVNFGESHDEEKAGKRVVDVANQSA
jgi:hypothetical protein